MERPTGSGTIAGASGVSGGGSGLARPWWRDWRLLWAVVLVLLHVPAGFAYEDGKRGVLVLMLLLWGATLVILASWGARYFSRQDERKLEQRGLCTQGTVLDVRFVEADRVGMSTYVVEVGFRTAGSERDRTARIQADPESLMAQGLDPRPGMLVGRRVWVRYLPRSPWVSRVEGLADLYPDPCAASRKRTD